MNLASFDLNLLRVLDAILRERSTVRAGQRIGLSQPAVSAALGRLRAALGDPLMVRDGQSLQPTEFALGLAQPLRALLEEAERLLSRPAFDPATATATFRFAGPDFFTEMLLPDLMGRLERTAPGITLRYSDALSTALWDDLREGRLDLMLMPQAICPDWLENEVVLRTDYRIVARRGHPILTRLRLPEGAAIPMDVYAKLRHVAFRVTEGVPEMEDRVLADLGCDRTLVLTVPSFTAVWRAVSASDLVGIVPRRQAERAAMVAGLRVHALPFSLPKVTLCQAWHRRNAAAPGLAWLRREIAEVLTPLDDGDDSLGAGCCPS
ncbi:LysR family transcriptional regulator [Tabrizicola piscis]|nr:LysR family transcriptional regulator [Tabrizicola piscis]